MNVSKGEQRAPGFLEINPVGKIPAIGELQQWAAPAVPLQCCPLQCPLAFLR